MKKKIGVLGMSMLASVTLFAQNQLDFQTLEGEVDTAADTIKNIVGYLIWAVLAGAILYAAYQVLIEGGQKTKQAITALLVGLIVVGLGYALGIL